MNDDQNEDVVRAAIQHRLQCMSQELQHYTRLIGLQGMALGEIAAGVAISAGGRANINGQDRHYVVILAVDGAANDIVASVRDAVMVRSSTIDALQGDGASCNNGPWTIDSICGPKGRQ